MSDIVPRRYLVVPMGSAGDVHPLVWLARLLASRGHEVIVIAQTMVAEIPRRAGLQTVETGSAEEQLAVIEDPDLWHPHRGFACLARRFPGWARETLGALRERILPGRTVVIAGGVAFGGRIAAEAWGVPLITAQLQPSVFLSVEDMPVMRPGTEWLRRAPRWLRRAFFAVAHFEVDRRLAAPLNRIRAELGLTTRVRRVMGGWWMSPDRVLGLFPDWFAAPQSDWPLQTVTTRFPLYDESEERVVCPELEAFLRAGEPPVLLTAGSANKLARAFFTAALGACWDARRRAVVVTPYREQLPATLAAGVRYFEYVPFSRVFPRCSVVVHHGGIGTCAQALAAGVPQLMMPMSHDQPDNANRIRRMGVGDFLYPRYFQPRAVLAKLQAILGSEIVAAACQEARSRMATQMSGQQVAEIIEQTCVAGDRPVRGAERV